MAVGHPAVEDIFEEAIRRSPGTERINYVDEACGTDAELRQRVDRLLRAFADAGSFLESPADESAPTIDQAPTESPGSIIGPYKLLQEIGHGGMGVVFMAEQSQPVKRRVALKIIKPGMDSRQVIARFEAERQALSMMDHPNIAKVLDAGTTSTGRPYFVMELVKGQPITKYCDEHHMTPRQRLELLLPVCQAIQHAHQKGIIHRDIKPSNILVAEYDSKPVPKVIDFGVAKAIHQPLTDKTMFTGFGNVVGTLEYMSPEQAKVNQLDIDTRSDIYSLGVLMYELLTGSTPFDRKRLKQAAWDEMLRIIREEEPQRPSTRISTTDELPSIAVNRGTEPKKLSSQVHGELDWIVMKALDKDRNRRYETANGFAMDLQRYLTDEPVQACPPSAGYRFRKFAQRNKGVLITTSLVSIALILGTVVSIWQAMRATKARNEAELARNEEAAQRALAVKQRAEADDQRSKADVARKQAITNLQKAREAVDTMLTRVAEEKLLDVPKMEPLRKSLLEDALKFYDGLRQHNSSDPELQFETALASHRIGCIHYQMGHGEKTSQAYLQAISQLTELVERFSDNATFCVALAECRSHYAIDLTFSGYPNKGVQEMRKAIALMQGLVAAYPNDLKYTEIITAYETTLCQGLLKCEKYDESELVIRHVLKKNMARRGAHSTSDFLRANDFLSDNGCAYRYLGDVLQAKNNFREAEDAYHRSIALIKENEANYNSKYTYKENLFCSFASVYRMLLKVNRFQEAENHCRSAVLLAQELANDFPNSRNRNHYAAGKADLVEILTKIASTKPTNENRQRLEDYLSATWKEYRALVERSPEYLTAQEQLGTFLLLQLRPFYESTGRQMDRDEVCKEALAIFEKLSQINDSQSWLYWGRLGEARRWLGKNNEALIALNKSIELKSDEYAPWYWRGDTYTNLKQHDKAIQDYTRVIEFEPKNAWAWRNRALNYTKLNQWDKAVADYLKAVSVEPGIVQFRTELADAQMKLGKTDEAISTYQKIMEKCPQDHNIPHHLGKTLLQSGRKVEAQAAFRRAVELLDTLVTGKPELRDTLGHNLRYLVACLDTKTHAKEQEQLLRKAVEQFKTISQSADSASKSNFLIYEGDTHRMLGEILQVQNQLKDAEAAYRQAISCFSSVQVHALDESISDAAWRRSTIETTFKELHQLLRTSSKQSEVASLCQQAIQLYEKMATERPKESYFKQQLEKWRQELAKLKELPVKQN